MTQTVRKLDSRRNRKKVLRSMKKLVRLVRRHAQRYRQKLADEWRQTDLKRGQVDQILKRLDAMIRIGILKNDFLGRTLRSKGFANRERAVAWAVLAHNIWLIARIGMEIEKEKREAA